MSDLLNVNLSLLPEGAAWNATGDFLKFLEANAKNKEAVRNFLKSITTIRAPLKTAYLSDLEREFGIQFVDSLTEAQRRLNLLTAKTSTGSLGPDYLQSIFDQSGFNVQVHRNRPAVDPSQFIDTDYYMVDGNENAVDGNENAIDGVKGGYYLANGPIYDQSPAFISADGNENMVDGNENAVDGRFDRLTAIKIEPIPNCESAYSTICGNIFAYHGGGMAIMGEIQPQCWKHVFFIGGDVTLGVYGEIIYIEFADVPASRRIEFETLVLKYKPTGTWAAMMINYIN